MRIAALALGVLAGLVASLILALGGLDTAALTGVDPRQLSLFRFVLFIIANLGVFGAGLVLAAPLAGAIVLVVGALTWIVAAFVLHHGPDYVMLTSPGLLLLAAALAVVAIIRRPHESEEDYEFGRTQAMAAQRAAMDTAADDLDEDQGAMPVGASFFGEAGTATNMRGAMSRPEPPRGSDSWEPVRHRVEPPRTKPMFRQPDDEYDDDESGFSRGARITSSILSFGLYGALAAAAVLVFVNFRGGEPGPLSAARVEASAVSVSKVPAPSSAAIAATALAPALEASGSPTVAPAAPALAPQLLGASSAPALNEEQPPLVAQTSDVPAPILSPVSPSEAPALPVEPSLVDTTQDVVGPTDQLMPFAMPPAIAAGRTSTPPYRSAPAPHNDTGL